jgi:hypothetical protein
MTIRDLAAQLRRAPASRSIRGGLIAGFTVLLAVGVRNFSRRTGIRAHFLHEGAGSGRSTRVA